MIDEKFARLRAYRNNINHYHRLLRTELSELERQFIERRLSEEKSAIDSLACRLGGVVEANEADLQQWRDNRENHLVAVGGGAAGIGDLSS
jgi:hypothetical protein